MALFQYQSRVQPVSTSPETVTVDRWLPTWVQPSRALAAITVAVAGVFAPPLVPSPIEPVTVDRWAPTFTQPRPLAPRLAGYFAEPASEAPESTSVDRWSPTWTQPSPTPPRLSGQAVGPVWLVTETVTVDRFAPTFPNSQPLAPRIRGQHAGPVWLSPESTTVDRWAPTFTQPRLALRRHAESVTVIPIAVSAAAEDINQWAPLWTLPRLLPGRPGASIAVAPVAPQTPSGIVHTHIYANDGAGGPVDYTTIVGTATGLSFDTPALADGSDWLWAVRNFDTGSGLEERNVDAVVEIVVSAAGADVTAQPAAPQGLSVTPKANGGAFVAWQWITDGVGSKPTGFHVYTGTPAVSYSSPVATVPYASGRLAFSASLAGLTDGKSYQVGVRAYNATGEEPNVDVVTFVASATGPLPVDSLAGTAVY